MKRCLSCLLVILLAFSLLSLGACGTEEDQTSAPVESTPAIVSTPPESTPPEDDTPDLETLKNSLPKEYLNEKVEAGLDATLVLCAPSLSTEVMVEIDTGMKAAFEARGFSYMSSAFDADTGKQIEQLENYTTMGVSLVMTLLFDSSIADIVNNMMDAGIYVVIWNFQPEFPVSMSMTTNQYKLGEIVGQMVNYWVDDKYAGAADGSVHAAVFANEMNPTYLERFNGIRDTMNTNPKINIAYEEASTTFTVDMGYLFAENAFTYDPEIKVLVTFTAAAAMGVNNYVYTLSYTDEQLSGIAAFGTDNDFTSRDVIDMSKSGESILRGLASSGTEKTSEYIIDFIFRLIDGEIAEGTNMEVPIYTYDAVGFNYDER